jgi:hypothetical protein
MPSEPKDAEAALQKLGQRLRQGFAQQHPTSEKTLDVVKETVREQYTQEQEAKNTQKPAPDASKAPERKPDEPDQER